MIGVLFAGVISLVIFGGIRRIGQVAARLVSDMVLLYILCGFFILLGNITKIDDVFLLIINDAFTGHAVAGGTLGTVMITGIRRAAFSNEAGIGTESMAHGAASAGGLAATTNPAQPRPLLPPVAVGWRAPPITGHPAFSDARRGRADLL